MHIRRAEYSQVEIATVAIRSPWTTASVPARQSIQPFGDYSSSLCQRNTWNLACQSRFTFTLRMMDASTPRHAPLPANSPFQPHPHRTSNGLVRLLVNITAAAPALLESGTAQDMAPSRGCSNPNRRTEAIPICDEAMSRSL
ncbi:hypothetical protein FIBSPDRAFT_590490 [Athelia psychrophila]|uniref:Uncharacterized protein n=1 Tax=Athelia psychrophila TaxID=1759441 RepID=A0A166H9D8_9AGAM|nr:hypothetical protein FIBSPDRAFT_590490 [Fibularhizoctonia sp. CBS 109695]